MGTYRDEKNISACFLDHSAELLQNRDMEKAESILQNRGTQVGEGWHWHINLNDLGLEYKNDGKI